MANLGTGHVKLPPDFDIQGQNAAAEWKFWRTSFEDYLVATGINAATEPVKLSILRNIIGTESARIMTTFVIPEDETNKYSLTLKLIEKYVNPRINECFERYNFLRRVQKEGESFEHFLTECRHLIRSCNYNAVDENLTHEDKALRDKIVMGIRDPVTREALLRIDQLSLDKAIHFCRTSEQSKNQSIKFQEQYQEDLNCVRKDKKNTEGCPLWESNEYTEHERRQLLIARLPNVETLNGGGKIGHDERESAERAFIRYYMDKPESERPERYFELVSIHGKLDPLVSIDLRPEKRVKVLFTCGTNSEVRSVDVYRTVSDLKTKLEAFAGFSAAKMRLYYVDQDFRDMQGPEEMKYPHKQLYSYNISSGDEIIIDYKARPSEKNPLNAVSQSI